MKIAELSVIVPETRKEKKEQSIATTAQSTISQAENTAMVFQKMVSRAFKSLKSLDDETRGSLEGLVL